MLSRTLHRLGSLGFACCEGVDKFSRRRIPGFIYADAQRAAEWRRSAQRGGVHSSGWLGGRRFANSSLRGSRIFMSSATRLLPTVSICTAFMPWRQARRKFPRPVGFRRSKLHCAEPGQPTVSGTPPTLQPRWATEIEPRWCDAALNRVSATQEMLLQHAML